MDCPFKNRARPALVGGLLTSLKSLRLLIRDRHRMICQKQKLSVDPDISSHEVVRHRTWRSIDNGESADHSSISQHHHLLIAGSSPFGVVGLTSLNPFSSGNCVGFAVHQTGVVVNPDKVLGK